MNAFRLFWLVAFGLAVSAIPFSAAAVPQSPILFDKQNEIHRNKLNHALSPKSFKYPTDVTLEVGREKKDRRGGQPPTEYHDKVKIKEVKQPVGLIPTLQLEVGGMLKEYTFNHFHFHRTAEHLETQNLNDLYGMELHMVHTRPKPDKECSSDQHVKDGNCELAVVGRWINVAAVPVEVGPPDPDFGHNADFDALFDAFAAFGPFDPDPTDAKKDKQHKEVKNFNMKKALLPSDPRDYEHYRYQGSLTTTDKQGPGADVLLWNNMAGPPVTGSNETSVSDTPVEWTMFQEPLTISENQRDQYSAFINNIDNHFGAQYTRDPFSHLFGVWKTTNGHNLRFIAIPEPSAGWLLAVAGVVATRRMRGRGKSP